MNNNFIINRIFADGELIKAVKIYPDKMEEDVTFEELKKIKEETKNHIYELHIKKYKM